MQAKQIFALFLIFDLCLKGAGEVVEFPFTTNAYDIVIDFILIVRFTIGVDGSLTIHCKLCYRERKLNYCHGIYVND